MILHVIECSCSCVPTPDCTGDNNQEKPCDDGGDNGNGGGGGGGGGGGSLGSDSDENDTSNNENNRSNNNEGLDNVEERNDSQAAQELIITLDQSNQVQPIFVNGTDVTEDIEIDELKKEKQLSWMFIIILSIILTIIILMGINEAWVTLKNK
ncbi:hypothetical protein HYW21_04285 [Candidatus Woesearchaeota archaeon]|nr:hypothetical protein [Candidatus Woesearchaeota archaeon]